MAAFTPAAPSATLALASRVPLLRGGAGAFARVGRVQVDERATDAGMCDHLGSPEQRTHALQGGVPVLAPQLRGDGTRAAPPRLSRIRTSFDQPRLRRAGSPVVGQRPSLHPAAMMTLRHSLELRVATAADAPGLSALLAGAGLGIEPRLLADRITALRQASATALIATQWGPPSGLEQFPTGMNRRGFPDAGGI